MDELSRPHGRDHRRGEWPRPGDGGADGGRRDAPRPRRHRGGSARRPRRPARRRRHRGRRPAHGRVAGRGHRPARRARLRAVRRRPRPVQQRRRRQARPVVGPDGRRLALGARRRPVERHPRRAGVRPAHAGRSRRAGTSSTRRRCPACCRSPTWPPTASPRRRSSRCRRRCSSTSMPRVRVDRRVRALPRVHRHPHHRERAQPAGRAHGRPPPCPPWHARQRVSQPTMDAAEVAGHVVDAITANRFWILTHEAYRDVIQQRAAGDRDGRPPDGATDLVTAAGRSSSGPREPRHDGRHRDDPVGLEQDVADPPALAHLLHVLGDLLDRCRSGRTVR